MNKTIVSISIGILVLGGLIWIAQPNFSNTASSSTKSNEALTVEETGRYDFGSISMSNGEVKHRFNIRNVSDKVVSINKIYTSCMCTTATLVTGDGQFGPYGMPGHGFIPKIEGIVDPGENATIEITFDPEAHGPAGVGRITRVITLENDAGQPIELQFSATVTP